MLVDGHRLVKLVAEALAEEDDVRFHNTLACGGLRGGHPSQTTFYLAKNNVICLGANQLPLR